MLPPNFSTTLTHTILFCLLISGVFVFASENKGDRDHERCEKWDSANTFVAKRQCDAYTKLNVNLAYVRDRDLASWQGFKAEVSDYDVGHCEDLFRMYNRTRWEMRVGYCMLLMRVEVVEEIVSDGLGINIDPKPVFGTVPLMQLNGIAARLPTGETVMVIDASLLTFSWLLAKVAALSLPGDQETNIDDDKRRKLENVAGRKFRDLLWSYLTKGNPGRAKQYQLPAKHEEIATTFLRSIEYFIVAHEYGHLITEVLTKPGQPIYLEVDLSSAIVREHLKQLAGFGSQSRVLSHLDELTADFHGFSVSKIALQKEGRNLAFALAGPTLYFVLNDMVCRGLGLLHSGMEGTYPTNAPHPSPMVRLAHLRSIVSDYGGEESAAALMYSQQLELVLESHWKTFWAEQDGLMSLLENELDRLSRSGRMPASEEQDILNTGPYFVRPAPNWHRRAEQCAET